MENKEKHILSDPISFDEEELEQQLESTPVSSSEEPTDVQLETLERAELRSRCIACLTPPIIKRRMDVNGKPTNGNSQDFEHSFSQTDVSGIKFDFREGLRVFIPANMSGSYKVIATDSETGFKHFETIINPGESVSSRKKFYVPWHFTVTKDGKEVMSHTLSLEGKEVAIHYPKGGIGDTIAWFSYAKAFQEKHKCHLTCCMPEMFHKLFSPATYAHFEEEIAWRNTPYYAVYHMGIFSPDNENEKQPFDFRLTGLHHNAANILGLRNIDTPPEVYSPEIELPREPYVCIASRASCRCKEWLNMAGWPSLIEWLHNQGYKVIDIDKDFIRDDDLIPYGSTDMTGDIPLAERAALIKGAKAFIGVSSGLSWLAWCCKVPVVLISGWTLPITEFRTPYRVINTAVCHGCWNDMREEFDHYDTNYCPRHKNTARQHECSRGISAQQVINVCKKIKGFCNESEG